MEWEDLRPAQPGKRFGYRKCGHAGVCGYFLLYPGQQSLWCGAGPGQSCLAGAVGQSCFGEMPSDQKGWVGRTLEKCRRGHMVLARWIVGAENGCVKPLGYPG